MANTAPSSERADLLEALTAHRAFLRQTAEGLADAQARTCPTVSELSVGGIIKHVASTEQSWADFMVDGGSQNAEPDIDWANPDAEVIQAYQAGFRLLEDETLAGVLADYDQVARATDRLVGDLDLNQSFPLPPAPWSPPGAVRSVRRTILHIAETAQHAGHADIIRESIDGARTMG